MKCPNCGNDKFYIFEYSISEHTKEKEEGKWLGESSNPNCLVEEDDESLLCNLSDEDLYYCRKDDSSIPLDICTECGTALS